jgi:N-acetylglucosaminyldiphosphoundecaprenol N-acetyl-beta-D-mannosaminyltransferase
MKHRQLREARTHVSGFGCPRQEVWAFENVEALSMPCLAVGAAFDFHAGTLPQAPPILQRLGLEWLFRLAHEPKRLWRRYVLLNPKYVALVLAQWAGVAVSRPTTVPPPNELRFG